jgi:prevent-host-death family protein
MNLETRGVLPASEARLHFGALIQRVRNSKNPVVIEKMGVPVMVLLAPEEFERLLRDAQLARFDRLSRAAGLEAEQIGLTEEMLAQEMEQIRLHEHRETYG